MKGHLNLFVLAVIALGVKEVTGSPIAIVANTANTVYCWSRGLYLAGKVTGYLNNITNLIQFNQANCLNLSRSDLKLGYKHSLDTLYRSEAFIKPLIWFSQGCSSQYDSLIKTFLVDLSGINCFPSNYSSQPSPTSTLCSSFSFDNKSLTLIWKTGNDVDSTPNDFASFSFMPIVSYVKAAFESPKLIGKLNQYLIECPKVGPRNIFKFASSLLTPIF